MKFELVEPSSWPEHAPEQEEAAVARPAPSRQAPPVLFEDDTERLRSRSEDLGKRLTRTLAALQPTLDRMHAAIARSEQNLMAGTGHETRATAPENFRANRFRQSTSETVTPGGSR
ncbi:hypothetical protein ACOALZ_15410 [Nocardiopsis algeriensis]|uniref:hypothetical protein n=1 Tax=Nocardiopsis algeriensis TaxID=1478215 RepID=UPI003B43C3D7